MQFYVEIKAIPIGQTSTFLHPPQDKDFKSQTSFSSFPHDLIALQLSACKNKCLKALRLCAIKYFQSGVGDDVSDQSPSSGSGFLPFTTVIQ